MSKVLYKFYDLETITEEELNQLSLERNTYRVLLDKIKKEINIVSNADLSVDNYIEFINRLNEILKGE